MIPQKSRSIDEQPRELVWLKQVPTLRVAACIVTSSVGNEHALAQGSATPTDVSSVARGDCAQRGVSSLCTLSPSNQQCMEHTAPRRILVPEHRAGMPF